MKKLLAKFQAAVFGTPAQRFAAQQEIKVRIARNDIGGWSIYSANAEARALFNGGGAVGNFPDYEAARARAVDHNCWTVVEFRPALAEPSHPVAAIRPHVFHAPPLSTPPRPRQLPVPASLSR